MSFLCIILKNIGIAAAVAWFVKPGRISTRLEAASAALEEEEARLPRLLASGGSGSITGAGIYLKSIAKAHHMPCKR